MGPLWTHEAIRVVNLVAKCVCCRIRHPRVWRALPRQRQAILRAPHQLCANYLAVCFFKRLERLNILFNLAYRQVAPIQREAAAGMSGPARLCPMLQVRRVGELVILVAIAQNEFSGVDHPIFVQGAGILLDPIRIATFFVSEAAYHRLCDAVSKSERLVKFAILPKGLRAVFNGRDGRERIRIGRRHSRLCVRQPPLRDENMHGLPAGKSFDVRPAPFARHVSQQGFAQCTPHAATERRREWVVAGLLEAEFSEPRKAKGDRDYLADGLLLIFLSVLHTLGTNHQIAFGNLKEPFPGLFLALLADGQQQEATVREPAKATVQHSLDVAQLVGKKRGMLHDSMALMMRSSLLSLRIPNKASRSTVAWLISSIVRLHASK